MTKIKTICAAIALATGISAQAVAQETDNKEYKPYPHMFVGLQGGVQTTFTDYNAFKLIRPTASVSFGSFFTPVVGARLHVNGLWNQGGFKWREKDCEYNYKYITTNVDLMLNLTNMFGKKDNYLCNVILLGGIGLNHAWDNDDVTAYQNVGRLDAPMAWKDNRLSHNARVGVMLDFNVCKHLGINLEVSANSLSDRYNSKINNTDDWQATAQLGIAYKFGFRKKKTVPMKVIEKAPEAPVVEEWATRVDTTWYDDVTYKDVVTTEKIEKHIYYQKKVTEPEATGNITEIAKFIENHKNCKITVTGYADKGTGNPRLNMKYSKQRAEKVTKALTDKGIDASIITTEWKGDTVQPFPENNKNRVAIVVVTGDGTKQEKVVTKKFRTEEVRYRVK